MRSYEDVGISLNLDEKWGPTLYVSFSKKRWLEPKGTIWLFMLFFYFLYITYFSSLYIGLDTSQLSHINHFKAHYYYGGILYSLYSFE